MSVLANEWEYQPRVWDRPPTAVHGRLAWVAQAGTQGLIEIRARTATSRGRGVDQLRKRQIDPLYGGHDKWLVTYQGLGPNGKPISRGRATQINLWAQKFDGKIGKLIGKEYDLGPIRLKDTIPFPRVDLPGFFGNAVEEPIRERLTELLRMKRRTVNQQTGGAAPGPDLLWSELAALYAELAEEQRDPFYAELAEELSHGISLEAREPVRRVVRRPGAVSGPAPAPYRLDALLKYYAEAVAELPLTTSPECKAKLQERLAEAIKRQEDFGLQVVNTYAGGSPYASVTGLRKGQYNFGGQLRNLFADVHKERMQLVKQIEGYTTPGVHTSTGTICVATFGVARVEGKGAYPTLPGRPIPIGTEAAGRTRDHRRRIYATEKGPVTAQIGGYVLGEQARAGAELKAEIITRSTGDQLPSMHAEARLVAQVHKWLDRDETWKDRVRSIEIHVAASPCRDCAPILKGLHDRLKNENLRVSVLQWGTLHHTTEPHHLQSLREAYSTYGLVHP